MYASMNQPEAANNVMWLTMSQPLISWVGMQGEIASRMADMAETWGRNRRMDAESAQDAVRRMSNTRDINEITSIYGDWMRGALDRASNDVSQYAGHAQGIMSAGMSGLRQMQEEGMAGARQMQQEGMAGARKLQHEGMVTAEKAQKEGLAAGRDAAEKTSKAAQ